MRAPGVEVHGAFAVVLVLVGCAPKVERVEAGPEARGTGSSEDGPGPSESRGSSTTLVTDGPGTSSGTEDDAEVGFIVPDPRDYPYECSIWDEDCPDGEKCMPWANDGGASWNALRCSPIAEDPDAVGDSCTVVGNGVSGIDSCELHAMCWNVDGETGIGTCVAMCTGDPSNPVCEDPGTKCSITSSGVLLLCIQTCDPIAQDCVGGEGCYAVDDEFVCAPVASGPSLGGAADPCEFINACDPGLQCVPGETVPGCTSISCCSPFCHIGDLEPPCLAGQSCVPYFAKGEAPPHYESVGVCGVIE